MLRPVPSVVSTPTPVARLVRQATALCASAALLAPLAAFGADAAPALDEAPQEGLSTVNVVGKQDARTEHSKSFAARSSTLFKGEQDIRDTPQPVTVITRQFLDERKLLDLTDVLNNTPGVQVDYTDSERLTYSSRGFTIDALQVDGLTFSQSGAAFVQPELGVKGYYFAVGGTEQAAFDAAANGGPPVPSHHSPLFKVAPRAVVTTGATAMTAAVLDLLKPS